MLKIIFYWPVFPDSRTEYLNSKGNEVKVLEKVIQDLFTLEKERKKIGSLGCIALLGFP